jgi:DNA-binding transcriptional ArsR family regulator
MKRPDRTQRLLACLGERSRFRVVAALMAGERCVSDLAHAVGLSQSCTTRHLQALRKEGLVKGTRQGKRVMFGLLLENPKIAELVEWVSAPFESPSGDGAVRQRAAMSGIRRRRRRPGASGEGASRASSPQPEPAERDGAPQAAAGVEAEPESQAVPRARIGTDLEDFLL